MHINHYDYKNLITDISVIDHQINYKNLYSSHRAKIYQDAVWMMMNLFHQEAERNELIRVPLITNEMADNLLHLVAGYIVEPDHNAKAKKMSDLFKVLILYFFDITQRKVNSDIAIEGTHYFNSKIIKQGN